MEDAVASGIRRARWSPVETKTAKEWFGRDDDSDLHVAKNGSFGMVQSKSIHRSEALRERRRRGA